MVERNSTSGISCTPIQWNEGGDLRTGRITGRIVTGGGRWDVSSDGGIWLWLNREGSGLIWGEKERFILKPGMYAMTGGGKVGKWCCVRYPGMHALELVVISRKWLAERLGKKSEWLHPDLRNWLADGASIAFCGLMGIWERELCDALAHAAEEPGPAQLLAEARVLEWAAVRLFRRVNGHTADGFCSTLRNRDPVKRAIHLLRERHDVPLNLAAIAKEVGVAPHYLSRRVSAESGMTLQRHLRRIRIELACEALDSGKMNVTEVALDVGYQSLSHFAKAFREETGESPRERLARHGLQPPSVRS